MNFGHDIFGWRLALRGVLVAIGLGLAGRAWSSPGADERFGVMTHFAQGWDPALVPQIAAAGIQQVRDELYWAEVEPEKGAFRFPAAYRAYLGALAEHGISPMIVLSFENRNYDDGDTPHTA